MVPAGLIRNCFANVWTEPITDWFWCCQWGHSKQYLKGGWWVHDYPLFFVLKIYEKNRLFHENGENGPDVCMFCTVVCLEWGHLFPLPWHFVKQFSKTFKTHAPMPCCSFPPNTDTCRQIKMPITLFFSSWQETWHQFQKSYELSVFGDVRFQKQTQSMTIVLWQTKPAKKCWKWIAC